MKKLMIKILKETGMTQKDLADHLGVAQSYVSQIVGGQRGADKMIIFMKLLHFCKMANICVNLDDIYMDPHEIQRDLEKCKKDVDRYRDKK